MKKKRKFFVLRNENEKKSYVKVKKKAIDGEGGENQKMTMYKWIGKERFGRWGVGDLIYRNRRKERRSKKYLPNLIDDLHGNLCMFYLASEAFNA